MSEKNPSNTIANWFIGIGVAGALFLWWASSGFPGIGDIGKDIYAGDWTCYSGGGQGLPAMYGPALDVADGEIVRAWHFDMASGTEYDAPFENMTVLSPTKIELDSTYPMDPNTLYTFTCEKD